MKGEDIILSSLGSSSQSCRVCKAYNVSIHLLGTTAKFYQILSHEREQNHILRIFGSIQNQNGTEVVLFFFSGKAPTPTMVVPLV